MHPRTQRVFMEWADGNKERFEGMSRNHVDLVGILDAEFGEEDVAHFEPKMHPRTRRVLRAVGLLASNVRLEKLRKSGFQNATDRYVENEIVKILDAEFAKDDVAPIHLKRRFGECTSCGAKDIPEIKHPQLQELLENLNDTPTVVTCAACGKSVSASDTKTAATMWNLRPMIPEGEAGNSQAKP